MIFFVERVIHVLGFVNYTSTKLLFMLILLTFFVMAWAVSMFKFICKVHENLVWHHIKKWILLIWNFHSRKNDKKDFHKQKNPQLLELMHSNISELTNSD